MSEDPTKVTTILIATNSRWGVRWRHRTGMQESDDKKKPRLMGHNSNLRWVRELGLGYGHIKPFI